MKHWLWIKKDGSVGGCEIFSGGWSDEHDLNDDGDATHGTVKFIRGLRLKEPDFSHFIEYSCDCAADEPGCQCPSLAVIHKLFVDGKLVEKPAFDVVLDGVVIPATQPVDRPPGSTPSLQLRGPMPDGTVVEAIDHPRANVCMLERSPANLTFTGGVTNTIQLSVPIKGMIGRVGLRPTNLAVAKLSGIRIRGW